MAYIENPIVENKDFKSIVTDVNGNFSEIRKEIDLQLGAWEKIGEVNIVGKPTTNYVSSNLRVLGEKCGFINFEGAKYEKLYLIANGTVGAYIKTNFHYAYNGDYCYDDKIFDKKCTGYINIGKDEFITSNDSPNDYPIMSCSIDNGLGFYWTYMKGETLTESNITIKLYGQKRPQWLLDALEIN